MEIRERYSPPHFSKDDFGTDIQKLVKELSDKFNLAMTFQTLEYGQMDSPYQFDFRLWKVVWNKTWDFKKLAQLEKKGHLVLPEDSRLELVAKVKHNLSLGLPTQHNDWIISASEISFMAYGTQKQKLHADYSVRVPGTLT